MGQDDQSVLLGSDAGYGFIAKLSDLQTKNKAGKALLSLPAGSKVLTPRFVTITEETYLIAVSNEGRMLVFPIGELPILARGKGNKVISIPGARVQSRDEFMVDVVAFVPGQSLKVWAGKRHLAMKLSDMEHYIGERGRRGHKLPRGFQRVDRLEVVD